MHPLKNSQDLQPLIDDIGNRPIVMLGEATHGTHEYYTWRTAITKRLIKEKQFRFIAVEGDWPDCYLINRYIKGYENDIQAVLRQFDRWPAWMWANWEIVALAEWLREYNAPLPDAEKVGFYGLDVYSLWESMKIMMDYLKEEDPQAAQYVKQAITCFEPFNEDEQKYARQSLSKHCRDEVLALLRQIRLRVQHLDSDLEAGFNTEQNALIAVNAERYYRSMISFDNQSWNIRDLHMMETLNRLLGFHGKKGIVWAHNTHVGDARATNMHKEGMINIGQLARDQYGAENVYLAGFAGYQGRVMAGNEWGAAMQEMMVPPAMEESIEAVLHNEFGRNGLILFEDNKYRDKIVQRAIGVVYHPERERMGNYVPSFLAHRYDALLYFDDTTALHPLHPEPHNEKIPETYPFGI